MDAVITYVNGLDPEWQRAYAQRLGLETLLDKRFRDWGTLKYLLRGIQTYMPFVDRVFLLVASESQVPEWVNRDQLRVVVHSEFIPRQFLPVFSSNPIEMYMHRIPELGEEFIYFNDDFFPLAPSLPEDFFREGRPVMSPSRHLLSLNMYKKICRKSDRLARKAASVPAGAFFLRPQHICAPMLKSLSEELYEKCRTEIDVTTSHCVRTADDLCQYIYTDYIYLLGRTVPGRLSNKHFSLAASSIEDICDFVENPDRKFACINDVHLPQEKFESYRDKLLLSFEKRLPHPSRYEK